MIVKRENVELIIPEEKYGEYKKLGFYAIDKAVDTAEKEFKNMKVDELRNLAIEKGVEEAETLNKAELLKVLGA